MSRENVEVVRTLFDTWNAGDMDAVRELYDANAIVYHLEGWPEPGPSVGREAVMRLWEGIREPWDADELILIDHSIDVGDRVAVRVSWRGTGQGPDMTMEMTAVFSVRKGRIVHHEFFWDHAEALETLGLSE
jgi:ketosteroid isomerase-like protein